MTLPPARPEDRCRRPEGPAWADTAPACFRSEAFAEDLPEPAAPVAVVVRLPGWRQLSCRTGGLLPGLNAWSAPRLRLA
jgi:hypothetical protein